MKIKALATSAIVLSGLLISASPSFADNNGNGPSGKVTICHATNSPDNPYNVITVNESSLKNGHSKDKGDIIPATPECIALDKTPTPEVEEPVEVDKIIGSSQSLNYECTGTVTYRVVTTTVTYASGREETSVEKTAVTDGAEVIKGCKLTPGDLPTKPAEPQPEAPVVAAPEAPSVVQTPVQPVAPAVEVPVTQPVPAAPLANTGTPVSETKPTELAYTGFDLQSLLIGLGTIGLGIGALILRKKLA